MDDIHGGAILIARQIEDSEIWEKPSAWFKIWVSLLLGVYWKDTKLHKRGSGYFTYQGIAETCNVTYNEVLGCLRWLKSSKQISKQQKPQGTLITICNYGKFQKIDNYHLNSEIKAEIKAGSKQDQSRIKAASSNHMNLTEKEDAYIREVRGSKGSKKRRKETVGQSDVDGSEKIPYADIMDHFNNVLNTKYKPTTPKTRELMRARWNEGFRTEDFNRVIDNMADNWRADSKMYRFLRPQTLFSNKFESYLNEKSKKAREIYEQHSGAIDALEEFKREQEDIDDKKE